MVNPSSPSTPTPKGPAYDSDNSPLSSPPSDLSPLASKRSTLESASSSPPTIPPGYRMNSIFPGDIMIDPKSRDSVADFRAKYLPGTDFSSGRYIDRRAYAVSMRHVPPNVPRQENPYFAPLGPATAHDVDRYRGPRKAERQKEKEQSEVSDPMIVKAERGGRKERTYVFHEDESWKLSMARTPNGKRKRAKHAGGEDDGKEGEEGDATLTSPGVQDTPLVRNFRIG